MTFIEASNPQHGELIIDKSLRRLQQQTAITIFLTPGKWLIEGLNNE